MTEAQRKLLSSADAQGRIPIHVNRWTLQACVARGWVQSKRDAWNDWMGRYITDAGRAALRSRPRREAPVAENRENITQAARRFGVSPVRMQQLLVAAKVYRRGQSRGRPLALDPEVVDRVLAARGRTPKVAAPAQEPAPPPATDAAAVPYDGPCETCIAVMECTGGRVLKCGWCKKGHPPWRSGMPPTRDPESEPAHEAPRRRGRHRG